MSSHLPPTPERNATVAVVVPISTRAELDPLEEVSYRHLRHHLGAYDTYIVAPRSLDVRIEGAKVAPFSGRFFGSVEANRRLMLSPEFYGRFSGYDYILLYHLDALVFSDELAYWCAQGWDYIGPPWLRDPNQPEAGFTGVGNGGFSLRRISSFLRVLESQVPTTSAAQHWAKHYAGRPLAERVLHSPKRWLKNLSIFNSVAHEAAHVRYNEDYFWALRASHYYPAFRIAPPEVAVHFAWEMAPSYCRAQSGRQLPFGCHAWTRYERAFWEPHLLGAAVTA